MSVTDKNQPVEASWASGKKKRRYLSAEKKYQLFLETQRSETPVGEVLRREGLYSSDLARIQRMVKEGALERLATRPGPAKKTVCQQDYDTLKQELQEKERVIAEMAVELAILRKKTNGGSWER
jgi:transposase-like protein